MAKSLSRCPWAKEGLDQEYHDTEWGVPIHDDRLLFEFLMLEGAQAGLSWSTILKKRANYRAAFDQFDPHLLAKYDERKEQSLLANAGIVRNRLKVASARINAQAFLAVREELGTFDAYLWQFVEGEPIVSAWQEMSQVPAKSPISDALSKDLKRRGFKFIGTTICYAFMQAVGLVNDHLLTCFRHDEVKARYGHQRAKAKQRSAR